MGKCQQTEDKVSEIYPILGSITMRHAVDVILPMFFGKVYTQTIIGGHSTRIQVEHNLSDEEFDEKSAAFCQYIVDLHDDKKVFTLKEWDTIMIALTVLKDKWILQSGYNCEGAQLIRLLRAKIVNIVANEFHDR